MKRSIPALLVVAASLLPIRAATAQSAIAGVVRDTTNAVLPGVLVEASSPSLIEKSRTSVTNDAGQYRIVDLRPGTYMVAFKLPGFTTVVREGVLLEANFTAPINVEMRVGGLEESVTVTGGSPVVDVQTSQRQQVVSQELIESLPTGRNFVLMAGTAPAVVTGAFDVGGSSTMWSGGSLLCSVVADSRTMIDGMVVDSMFGNGQCSCVYDNEAQTQEIAVQVSGGPAEYQLSGVLVNRVPRSGGNEFIGDALVLVAVGTCHLAFSLCPPGTDYGSVPHVDTLLVKTTVAPAAGVGAGAGPNERPALSQVVMASLSYVTGAHALKIGFQDRYGWLKDVRENVNGDINQLYRNGVPFAVQVLNTPSFSRGDVNADLGLYIQDTWTYKRLTLSPGLRWDHFNSSLPEQSAAAGRFVPERHFAAVPNVPNWNNVVPRFGWAYDVTGRGRTAVKGNIGLYVL